MIVKKAVEILQNQKAKIDDPKHNNDETWVFQTASFIKDFFGDNSPEYKFIAQFTFQVLASSEASDEDVRYMFTEKRKQSQIFLENCIETLNHKGLFRQPKQNFITRISETALWAIVGILIPGLILIGSFFGNMYSDKQNIELRQEKKVLQDSLTMLIKLTPSNNIAPANTNKVIKKTIGNKNPN